MTHASRVELTSPLGTLRITLSPRGVSQLHVVDAAPSAPESDDTRDVATRVRAWFVGDLEAFDTLAIDLACTAFEREVYTALRAIPPGTTQSYAQIARAVGRPRAVRAVGRANGRNPVMLIVPCHRVIGSDGSLTGFAAGLDRKRWLLDHERLRRRPDANATIAVAARMATLF